MAALANILLDDNYQVRGSDVNNFINTEISLKLRKVTIDPLDSNYYLDADIIIIGHSFCKEKLINKLNEKGKVFFEYNEFLDLYIDHDKLVSIAGSHGKTTLVKMLSSSFPHCSYLCGEGLGKKLDQDLFFFLESCEYQNHFLKYHPKEIIITNIDYDHVDFFKSENEYIDSFQKYTEKAEKVYILYSEANKINHYNLITYGLDSQSDYYLNYVEKENLYLVKLYHHNDMLLDFEIEKKPNHYLELLCATMAFYNEHNFDLKTIIKNLEHFSLPFQRFNVNQIKNHYLIIDYCHHPSQIKYNFEQCKFYYKSHRKIAIFKPDRTSRLVYFKDQFIKELEKYDQVFILPLSNTEPSSGHTSKELETDKIKVIEEIDEIIPTLEKNVDYVFSFMSSKDLSKEVKKIHDYLINHN